MPRVCLLEPLGSVVELTLPDRVLAKQVVNLDEPRILGQQRVELDPIEAEATGLFERHQLAVAGLRQRSLTLVGRRGPAVIAGDPGYQIQNSEFDRSLLLLAIRSSTLASLEPLRLFRSSTGDGESTIGFPEG